ncbi:YncE family protein [Streptomyces sp. NPDC055709]
MAVTPNGTRVYVTNAGSNHVSVIPTASNLNVATIPVGQAPSDAAVTPDGARVYVTNTTSNSVSVILTANNLVIHTIGVGNLLLAVAIGTVAGGGTPTTLTLELPKGKGKLWTDGSRDVWGKHDGLTLKSTLTAEGHPLEGRPIEFTTDSTPLCTSTTDSRGKATCTVSGKQD